MTWHEAHIARGAAPRIDHIVVLGWWVDESHCGNASLEQLLRERFHPMFSNLYTRVYERHR